ncbi:Mediator of RNA polymerase II transcription subunit 11 [Spatholobus suberectus]|nr:Mediator of RNA polymerase II transcription subunit 11 [Spatholobus suberectus]
MDSLGQTTLQRLQNVEKVLELAGAFMDQLANPVDPRQDVVQNYCLKFMQLINDIQVALRDEIKTACECRPFGKCDYSSRIANEISYKKMEFVLSHFFTFFSFQNEAIVKNPTVASYQLCESVKNRPSGVRILNLSVDSVKEVSYYPWLYMCLALTLASVLLYPKTLSGGVVFSGCDWVPFNSSIVEQITRELSKEGIPVVVFNQTSVAVI